MLATGTFPWCSGILEYLYALLSPGELAIFLGSELASEVPLGVSEFGRQKFGLEGGTETGAKGCGDHIPGSCGSEAVQGSGLGAIMCQGLLASFVIGEAEQLIEFSGTIIQRERSLLEECIIFPDLCATDEFKTIAGEIGLC
jgi:hypothetical protein